VAIGDLRTRTAVSCPRWTCVSPFPGTMCTTTARTTRNLGCRRIRLRTHGQRETTPSWLAGHPTAAGALLLAGQARAQAPRGHKPTEWTTPDCPLAYHAPATEGRSQAPCEVNDGRLAPKANHKPSAREVNNGVRGKGLGGRGFKHS